MSQVNITLNTNTIDINTTNNQIVVTDPTNPTTVNVVQPVTTVVEVITAGPQGPQGLPGTGSIVNTGSFVTTSSFNAYTGSSTSQFSGTSSFALTASYLEGYISPFPFTGSAQITGSLGVTGSIEISGSLAVQNTITSSGILTNGVNTVLGNTVMSGSSTIQGTTTMTGSLLITGSTTQVGDNTLLGNTILSGSIVISGSIAPGNLSASVNIYGDTAIAGFLRFNPYSTNIDTSLSASYIYVSGSTNDLYFTQNGKGYNNTTRLRWLEGNLYTGLLHGGLITTASSTTFNISSGSGIIVSLNATLQEDPYPTIQYVNWGNLTNQSLLYRTSSIQTFVGIDPNGQIIQQIEPWNDGQYNTSISIGTVLHQNQSTINATITYPNVAYGYKQRTYDFIKAFGPLKLSGCILAVSGSSTGSLVVSSGTAFADGRNYQTDPNNPSYITDQGTTISKLFRYYQSGSVFIQDTNNALGYGAIDPTRYNANGTLTPVPGTGANREWSVQRVFWYPNSATKGIVVYYGNATYTSEIDAAANLQYETFNETPNTQQNAIYLGALVVRNNANFTDSTSYKILPGGIFRNIGGSGGGGSIGTQTLFGLSDVNISNPTDGQPLVYNTILAKWQNSSTLSASLNGNSSTSTSASYAETASFAPLYLPLTGGTINGDIIVNGTASIAFLNVTYESASVIYSSGSNQFGDATNDTQTLIGTVIVSGSQQITGSLNVSAGISGSFSGSGANLFDIPASGITGLNLSQIATGSVTASVSPTQFTVTSGSVTEFQVTGTGITLGSVSTDIHRVTGSLNITGSTTLNGNLNTNLTTGSVPFISLSGLLTQDNSKFFWDNANKRLGIGTNVPVVELDVRGKFRTEFAGDPGLGTVLGGILSYAPSPLGLIFRGYGTGVFSIQNEREANPSQVYGLAIQPTGGNVLIGSVTDIAGAKVQIRGAGATSATTTLLLQNSSLTNLLTVRDDGSSTLIGRLNITPTTSTTSSLIVTGPTLLSGSQNTISGSVLTVVGSGSAQPVFTVQGSQGELFSVTDSLSGSLFSVNDISGLPIMEVFSDGTTLIGDYLDPMLITTKKVTLTNSGSFTVYSLPTASYDTAFFDYSIKSGSNARAGQIMAIQSGSAVNYTETTTMDFGSTSGVSLGVFVSGSNMVLTGSAATSAWVIKTIVRSL